MNRVILSASTDETILAVTRQHKLVDLEIEQQINTEIVGCIYKGIVKNIVPAVDGILWTLELAKMLFCEERIYSMKRDFRPKEAQFLHRLLKVIQI